MRQIIVSIAFIFSAAICSNIYAQETPPGAGDKDLRDTDVKRRSVEMERIERDAKKKGKTAVNPSAAAQAEDKLAAKYEEIKTDYEQIQLSQDAIIKAYQSSGKIDYAQISKSAQEINRSAVRLNSNLFPLPVENADAKKEEKPEIKLSKSVRDLIIDLDNTIGSFATSPMFQNLREIDAEVAKKARQDLEKIIELSALLGTEAQKMKANEK